jgi:PAS domain S-box-containing protein
MSIRILHFDTSLLDAQITWLTLKGDELQPEIEHVESFEEFEEALEEQTFDLVLSEYALQKRKTACDVIAYLKSKSIQVPVIVFSKVTDEKVVQEALKSGASDYVFKSHLKFLSATIKEVLNRKSQLKPEPQATLQLSEEFLKNLQTLRAQLVQLQSPALEEKQPNALKPEEEPLKDALPDVPSHASSSVIIEGLEKKINALTQTIDTLNASNAQLQTALEESRAQLQSLKEESEKKINALTQTIDTLNASNAQLQTALEESRAQLQSLKEESEKKINALTQTIDTLNASNAQLQTALEESRAQLQSLKEENAAKESQLESKLEEARQALNELTEAFKTAQEQATLAATAYEEERQASTRLKAELLEKTEREKALTDEVEKAQEVEMQLRIELQEAIITANQLQEAVANADEQLAQFEAMFKQYDAALNEQVTAANAFSEQIQAAKAELANAEEEKHHLESKLTAVQESAHALAQRFTKEMSDLRAQLLEETQKRQTLEQELSQATQTIQTLQAQPKGNPEKEAKLEAELAKLVAELAERTAELAKLKVQLTERASELAEAQSTISQLRADWEQANRAVERLENDVKILESSVNEKSAKLHEAQKELKAKERQLAEKSAILNALNLAVVMVGATGEIRYWNEGAAVFHGIPAGEALSKKSDEVMKYKYASSKERKAAMESLQSVGRWDGKIKYQTPDGEQKTAEMSILRLNDEIGNPIGVLTVLTDMTKRSTIESEYRNFKERIEPMLNAMPVALITFDDAGIITGIFGKSADQHHLLTLDSKGKSIYERYGKYPQLLAAFRRVLSGESVTTSLTVSESQVGFHFSPILFNGLIAGAVGVLIEAPVEQA